MRSPNVVVLSLSQAIGMCALPTVVLLGGAIGSTIAPSPAWATLPISIMVVGVAVSVIPAVMLMRRIGRRRGFISGAIVAALGALLAAYAVARGSFFLFCLATLVIGVNVAFVQQYRFAAAESVAARYSGRAVSFVLLGSLLAIPSRGRRTLAGRCRGGRPPGLLHLNSGLVGDTTLQILTNCSPTFSMRSKMCSTSS